MQKNYRTRSKRHSRHKSKKPFFVVVCCLTLLALTIGLLKSNMPFIIGNTNNNHRQQNLDETPWNLILTNKWNRIPDNYEIEFIELENGQLIDKRIYPELQEMFDNARNEGFYPEVVSGYRSKEQQESLLEQKINDYSNEGYSSQAAKAKAEEWVAIPGTSEHQLGIAVDINADNVNSMNEEIFQWLNQNAYKYGFIYRYPSDKKEITGVINEPWHYRYVGKEAAAEIQSQGICLEEYLNRKN